MGSISLQEVKNIKFTQSKMDTKENILESEAAQCDIDHQLVCNIMDSRTKHPVPVKHKNGLLFYFLYSMPLVVAQNFFHICTPLDQAHNSLDICQIPFRVYQTVETLQVSIAHTPVHCFYKPLLVICVTIITYILA